MADATLSTIPLSENPSRRALIVGAASIPALTLARPALAEPGGRLQLIYELQAALIAECDIYAKENRADEWRFSATGRRAQSTLDMFDTEGPDEIKIIGGYPSNFGRKYKNWQHVHFNSGGAKWLVE